MKIEPGNIWSGDRLRAVFTNPTELAKRKGNLKHSYPVVFRGKSYPDVESVYQSYKLECGKYLSFEELQALMVEAIACKLIQYPILVEVISENGGEDWINGCSHFTGARSKSFQRWEGNGIESAFIRCLLSAYQQVTPHS